ncbi:RNA-binding domain-containing protein [Mytilinidion resinicola]|uniref:RNA-binding domain-containing protein n=1 Tax=Mytilinidion resinicola TaxID=574789 RepID=A0A6A6YKM0_9PEZI|nr:RNA-binding domain-containing protein [Mytilinidion resinicola]KAF2809088.1 RNA-binding domain-containing protein [Mytilinidion resinicola]
MAPPKKQQQKLSLGDFLTDQALGSWADEMEDMPLGTSAQTTGYGGGRPTFGSAGGYADRGFASTNDRNYAVREALPLPTKPPYTAHLGNLSFDATEGDITDFFSGCEVTNVRIVEDKMERKPKGFGYVEFGSLDGLKKALELNGTQFQGRNIRISVAEPPKDREGQREITDWTRKGPLPDLPGGNRRVSERTGGGYQRNFGDGGSDNGSERGGDRRRPAFESDGKVRDFSNWERKGPLSPVPPTGGMREGGRVRSNDGGPRPERRQSPGWGEGRSNDGSRPPRREFADRPAYDRQPTAPELDNQWRTKMRPDAPAKSPTATPDASVPSSPAPSHAAPATRPRLNLAKRTVSESDPAPTSASSTDSKPNPFGAAKPIDTAKKEKEIEEKHLLAIREKKEKDEKAREEKRARDAAARAAEKEKDAGAQTPTSPKEPSKEVKENGEDKPAARNYEILRRIDDENGETDELEDDAVDAPANGNIVDDKAVKPKEVVRNPPKAETGAWRRKSGAPATSNESATQGMEDDGWSTVPQKSGKGRRGGPQGSRAIAS